MIAHLRGKLLEKTPTGSVIDVGGVGYAVLHSLYTFEGLRADPDGLVGVYTHLHVREDALQLYGFSTVVERRVFELLLGVAGVGPKLALAVLSGLAPASFARAIADENLAALTRISGVGRKTAERIVIDLRDKLAPAGIIPDASAPAEAPAPRKRGGGAEPAAPPGLPGRLYEDALAALTALGLHRAAAIEQVQKALEQGRSTRSRTWRAARVGAGRSQPTGRPRVGV